MFEKRPVRGVKPITWQRKKLGINGPRRNFPLQFGFIFPVGDLFISRWKIHLPYDNQSDPLLDVFRWEDYER